MLRLGIEGLLVRVQPGEPLAQVGAFKLDLTCFFNTLPHLTVER
jgi:hypothetical protein